MTAFRVLIAAIALSLGSNLHAETVAQQAGLPTERAVAAATLRNASVPADRDSDTLLDVQVAGRFSLRAQSATGVSLQLVDMATGPGEISGAAGTRDGRVDALLDKGTYKLRSGGATGATSAAALSVLPFREVEGASAAIVRGGQVNATLGDLQQRSYWIAVEKGSRVTVEAAGRALQDLRLWHNGSDLVDVEADLTTVEPKAGRPVTRARLDAEVEPGLYLVTAYGGVPQVWADGDAALPFHINTAPPHDLAGGWYEGVIGPSGAARFSLPAAANHVRIELPEIVPARLAVTRGKNAPQISDIVKNSREPVATLDLAGVSESAIAEVTGVEGQRYRLRALRRATSLRADRTGPHLVTVEVAGEGGDELPATVVLGEFRRGLSGTVLFSNAPRIAQGQAWRRKFNLRGPSTVLFEVVDAGPVAARTEGPGVTVTLTPLLGNLAPRADGQVPSRWDVEPGWYVLRIAPVENAVGILDLTFGTPGVETAEQPAAAPRAAIELGTYDFVREATYQVFTNTAPRLVTGPSLRPLPADISSTPLALHPGNPGRTFELRIPLDGSVTAVDVEGKPVAITTSNEVTDKDRRTVTVTLPAGARDRTVTLSWSRNPEPLPALALASAPPSLKAGQPFFFDLKNKERRRFTLDVAEGGLYRVETLGRLKTALDIATPYLPNLGNAADNGPGHNALLQTYLRAGAYRVNVSAADSAGRLAIVARPAPLPSAGVLVPGESGRASLTEGRGVVFPIEIAEAGQYRLDLYGLGREPTARLEDAEAWPITRPGPVSRLDQQLAAGRYRLVVLPQETDTRVVARLRRVLPDKPPEGHGPHQIALDSVQKFQWREPAQRDAPRAPDRWEFTLAGPSNVVLETSDGMIADLLNVGEAKPIAKIVYRRGFSGTLGAGRYAIEARSLGRNDRLDYELTLRSTEIQPGRPRTVDLPATIPFAIAADRVVSLTTYGREDMSAILKDKDGRVIERLAGRTDDWNIALSRRLPAGAYQLQLTGRKPRPPRDQPEEGEATEEADGERPERPEKAGVEVQLALPQVTAGPELSFARSAQVTGSQVHQFALPRVETGDLLLVAAQSSAEIVVSLERQDASGRWSAAGFRRGKDVFIAAPADADARPWRAAVWAVDGGSARITVAARAVRVPAQSLGAITLAPQALDGITQPVHVALIAIPASGLVTAERAPGLSEGSKPGRVLGDTEGGILAAQSDRLWLAGRGVAATIDVAALPATTGEIALTLGDSDSAIIPQAAVPAGRMRVWRAESTFGQPGLDAGRRMGVAHGSALASGPDRLRIWNADGNEALRLRVATIDLEAKPAAPADGELAPLLQPRSAQPVSLRPGAKKIEINLAAGTAALLDGGDRPVTVWGGHDAVTRTLEGSWTSVVLLNTADLPAPVSLSLAPAHGDLIAVDKVMKRFFGAAGSQSLRLEARAGDRLVLAGASATFVADSGSVMRGTSLALNGPGELVIEHEAGLVVAWIERGGASPFPVAPARPLVAPQSVKLEGQAMRFSLRQEEPALLHARTSAPVILSLAQGNEAPEILLYPAGAALHRYVGAGTAELRVYSPHDGALAGSLELTATPVARIAEGLGEARAVAPGATALFGFEVSRAGPVGVGIRSEPDRASARLLDATGKQLGEGVAQLHRLEPGRYLLEARVPANGRTTTIRPAVIGISPPPAGPPPEVTLQYLEMVGLTPSRSR